MFSFRRKTSKKEAAPPLIRASPSLPELSAKDIPWPKHLIDLSALPEPAAQVPPRGKPTDAARGSISSMYMSHPPSAFETRKQAYPRVRLSQRRPRVPTAFNLMVVGAQGTGKTSLLRLILDTADISPTATPEQKTAMERFMRGAPKRTESIRTACVEICESRFDRMLLSVIDTPGLNFQEGHELNLERQVSTIVKYLDTQFADTLNEESKVVRQSKSDQHVHLCIYMIDPMSIASASARRTQSSLPNKTRSEATVSYHPSDLSPVSDGSSEEDSDDELDNELTMSAADIRIIRRLMARVNVLPVVARADSLTNEKLTEVKETIRKDLRAAKIDFGVFGPITATPEDAAATAPTNPTTNGTAEPSNETADGTSNETSNGNGHTNGDASHENSDSEEPVEEERKSRFVIKLRPSRLSAKLSRSKSRSRIDLAEAANGPAAADVTDAESIASVRFSAQIVVKTDLTDYLPFALITPEVVHKRREPKDSLKAANRASSLHTTDASVSSTAPSEEGVVSPTSKSAPGSPLSPTVTLNRNMAYLSGPPADLRGVFLRKFRWGTIDVLSPEHCDFAALRTAVFSTHLKMLKIRTREVLYEKFRTEKLLARRATRNINEEQTRQLLKDLGL